MAHRCHVLDRPLWPVFFSLVGERNSKNEARLRQTRIHHSTSTAAKSINTPALASWAHPDRAYGLQGLLTDRERRIQAVTDSPRMAAQDERRCVCSPAKLRDCSPATV